MTTTRLYLSSDAGALVLSGEADKLRLIINQCLVTGTGLGQAALGWTEDYTTTNISVFRSPEGIRFPFRLNDNGPGAGTYKECRIYGAESFSAVSTATNLFPTAAQEANGLFVRKSATLDSTARPYFLIGDERSFYFGCLSGDTANVYLVWYFGEIYSKKTGDVGNSILSARGTENSASVTGAVEVLDAMIAIGSTQNGSYIARNTAGSVGAIAFGKSGNTAWGGLTMAGSITSPNGPDSKYYSAKVYVHHLSAGNHVRGWMRGLRQWLHPVASVSDAYTIAGTGSLVGKTFRVVKGLGSSGVLLFDLGTWPYSS